MNRAFMGAVAVTPSNTTVLPDTKGIYVGGAGNLAVKMYDGSSVVFTAVPVGTMLPISVTQVLATGTTATLILALY